MPAIALSLAGCGLESLSIVLEPPTPAIAGGTETFSFKATSANSEPEFLGFEVYYRIFANTLDDPYPTSFNTFEEMVAAGFKRLYDPQWAPGQSGFRQPLVASAPGLNYQVTIDFNVAANTSYPELTTSGLVPEIDILAARRAVAGVGEWKRFQRSAFLSGEADLTDKAYASLSATPEEPVVVVMFALSYGFDPLNEQIVYSPPVAIGFEDFFIRDFTL